MEHFLISTPAPPLQLAASKNFIHLYTPRDRKVLACASCAYAAAPAPVPSAAALSHPLFPDLCLPTSAQIARTRHIMPPKKDPTTRSNEYAYGGAAGEFAGGVAGFAAGACVGDPIDGGAYGAQMGAATGVIASEAHHGGCSSSNKKSSSKKK